MDTEALYTTLRKRFSGQNVIPKTELIDLLQRHYQQVKPATLDWRLHELVQTGILMRTGYGLYQLNDRPLFIPTLSPTLRKLSDRIKAQLPFTDCCVWDTGIVADLMIQQPMSMLQLVEVDRVAVSSVYQLLQNQPVLLDRKTLPVYLYEDWLTLSRNGMPHPTPIIIKALISEAPMLAQDRYRTAPLEKILVDLMADQRLFFTYQEELDAIVHTAFDKFIINRDKLRRYARRRNRADQVGHLLNQLVTTHPLP